MLTSTQIRQSFLDFFREKQHTIVPSSSLLPDSPNLLFTNAGMNQFVPIFLGEKKADVSKWGGAIPGSDTRAADTQKCIRAGGKHNDLDDVGLDTYHHTFFEMLGNWSFGDYFKKEAIEWAWELVVDRWKFPPQRLYATIYQPDKSLGDPAERDEEAWGFWAGKFRGAGLDPAMHIVNGNKKDNFWMMGETGPCGPCSELHVDLTPAGDTRGALVNKGTAECIEIWNLVFIQFNANPDGTFSPLPAQHVDTGMGFERVTSIIQGTKDFSDFANAKISNYETDIFRPIFEEVERLTSEHGSPKKYASTLPQPNAAGQIIPESEQEKIDVAFRVIADHIRTLSFAIADGIQPGNTDRNYVLRRILRRAVRYGRTLGFTEPFFYKLAAVLAREMGDVFPEIRAKQKHVEEVLRREEEAFNKTLDKGIDLFEREAARLIKGSAGASPAVSGAPPDTSSPRATLYKRRLPHFERPWAKYMVTFTTRNRRVLSSAERDIVLTTITHDHDRRYELYAACVMPDHVHLLIEPQIKGDDAEGKPIFHPLSEICQTLKSVSAHKINKAAGTAGQVWENESFDRLIRGNEDLEEKFLYICHNPRNENLVRPDEEYSWLWTQDFQGRSGNVSGGAPNTAGEAPALPASPLTAKIISGAFAFRLYDEQGFPLDLTELMARERGLTVDVAGFNALMEQQRARARAAQKKEIITVNDAIHWETKFVGYQHLESDSLIVGVNRQETQGTYEYFAIVDESPFYAEMGGQVGDTGALIFPATGGSVKVANTFKRLNAFYLKIADAESVDLAREVGNSVHLVVDFDRRRAIERHHTVTHLLHWALHEVVSKEATQKGSFVGPDKLTFDFNSAALTPVQVRDIERLVNERIVENTGVSWTEVPYADVRGRGDIMQFFGDKYGETVRVVQIGGHAATLDGYSMELCAGTHTRATGEIGLFRINAESAIAAGVRRIEAVAGLSAYDLANADTQRLHALAVHLGTPLPELEKRIEGLLTQQKELERSLKSAIARNAAQTASWLLTRAQDPNSVPLITQKFPDSDADYLQAVVDALKGRFQGVVVLGGTSNGAVVLVASVSSDFTAKVQAGKIIQAIAPLVGGKGGGKPEGARGGGKDPSKLDDALAHVKTLLG